MKIICNICKHEKDVKDFYKNSKRCKNCYNKAGNDYKKKHKDKIKSYRKLYNATHIKERFDLKNRLIRWKYNADKRNIEWKISLEDLQNMPQICYYTGIELTLKPNNKNTISLDRLYSDKGYVKENVVFCCADINKMKREFPVEYFLYLCKKIATHKNE